MAGDVQRVLIADADAALRQRLYSALLELDVFSDCVSNTTDALEKVNSETYGVVVVDVGLPHGNVEDLISRIAGMPAAERPVVLVLAANPEAARSLDVEIVQIVLRRPVYMAQLIDVVKSCIRSFRARDSASAQKQDENGDYLIS